MTKYIGLDLGSVTCGVSASDTGFIARTVKTIRFPKDDYDRALDLVLELLEAEKPELVVLGYPKLLNDEVGERGHICEEFKEILERESGIKVELWDERYTTKIAEEILLEADISRKKRKKKIDQLAAVQILQTYLDSHGNK